ncbi:hypothetical protein [Candidatus Methanoperedens nitratireducens]|uniref:Uncharacterized protein n=1 Tax=Candidatus Methanoperedens nitratireducens TaxID=1392998 RepID=A0A284VNP2_9EURY|nr:hypothetical protein [Candidatus Methanoperedens nitroreducens]SNQ60872.1 hypothetical protein MNV_2060014 [Candidatus Methanoperedens nitroreducens]
MTKSTNPLDIIFGFLILISGLMLFGYIIYKNITYRKKRKFYHPKKLQQFQLVKHQPATRQMSSLSSPSSQSINIQSNIKKGELFEDYILTLFNNYYTIVPRTESFPDFIIKYNPNRETFAIECKWKQELFNESYNINDREFLNYKEYQKQKKIPFFMILGLDGTPSNPNYIFIIPLERLKYPDIKNHYLNKFKRPNTNKPFWYDPIRKQLT